MKSNDIEPITPIAPLQTGEVAQLMKRSTDRVRQLAKSGELPSRVTARGVRLFERAEVEQFIKRRFGFGRRRGK